MPLLNAKVQDVFDEPACEKNRSKDSKARKNGCSKPLIPGGGSRRMRFRWRQDRAAADHRRRAPDPWASRL